MCKKSFSQAFGHQKNFEEASTLFHPLLPPGKQAAYQKHLSSLSSCFVVVPFPDQRAIINLKKASSLLTLPTALAKYINKRIYEAYIYIHIYKAYIHIYKVYLVRKWSV